METTSVILIVTIGNLILTPVLSYLVNSRCTYIETPCCTITRDVKDTPDTQDSVIKPSDIPTQL